MFPSHDQVGIEVVQGEAGFTASGGPLGSFLASYASPEHFEVQEPKRFQAIVNKLLDPSVRGQISTDIFLQNPKLEAMAGTVYDTPDMNAVVDSLMANGIKAIETLADLVATLGPDEKKNFLRSGKKVPQTLLRYSKNRGNQSLRDEAIRSLVHNSILGGKGLGRVFDGDKLLDADQEGKKIVYDVSPGIVLDTLQALDRVFDFAINQDTTDEDCDSIGGVLSTVRGTKSKRVLVKLPSESEGMIIPGDFTH